MGANKAENAFLIRLSNEQADRIKRGASRAGLTVQAFMLSTVLKECDAQDEKRAANKAKGNEPFKSQGLGLRREPVEQTTAAVAATEVNVNLHGVGGANGNLVETLAKHVVSGEKWSRDGRLKVAVGIIKNATPDEAERERLCKALDEEVTRLDGQPKPAPDKSKPGPFGGGLIPKIPTPPMPKASDLPGYERLKKLFSKEED